MVFTSASGPTLSTWYLRRNFRCLAFSIRSWSRHNFISIGIPLSFMLITIGTIALSNDTGTGVDLSADVTFTTAGDYILEVEVNDGDVHYITDTVNVHVYADGCEATKIETPYTEADARIIGDTNYDCEVNLVDLAAMALSWLDDVTE